MMALHLYDNVEVYRDFFCMRKIQTLQSKKKIFFCQTKNCYKGVFVVRVCTKLLILLHKTGNVSQKLEYIFYTFLHFIIDPNATLKYLYSNFLLLICTIVQVFYYYYVKCTKNVVCLFVLSFCKYI